MVGKIVGTNVYFHKSALPEMHISIERLVEARKKLLPAGEPYDIIKVDTRKGTVSFCQAIGWKSLHEPFVGIVNTIKPTGVVIRTDYGIRARPQIYHHKWTMVSPGYRGFNVEKEKARSHQWETHPKIKAMMKSDPHFKSRIGYHDFWAKVMADIGMQL